MRIRYHTHIYIPHDFIPVTPQHLCAPHQMGHTTTPQHIRSACRASTVVHSCSLRSFKSSIVSFTIQFLPIRLSNFLAIFPLRFVLPFATVYLVRKRHFHKCTRLERGTLNGGPSALPFGQVVSCWKRERERGRTVVFTSYILYSLRLCDHACCPFTYSRNL